MHSSLLRKGLLFAAGLALVPPTLSAQAREVVSKQVSVGRSEAELRLEFADDGAIEIRFADGSVFVDRRVVGAYQRGDELEDAWRSLLGQAVALDDGPLAEALVAWTVPDELSEELARVGRAVDEALEAALAPPQPVRARPGSVSVSVGDESALVEILLRSGSRLGLLGEALDGLEGSFTVYVDEDVRVPAGSTVEGTLIVIGGDASIGGEVEGGVVVVDGVLELLDGSRVGGDVRLVEARLVRSLGDVGGRIVDLHERERDIEDELRRELRDEIRSELRSELRNELRNVVRARDDDGFSFTAPFRSVLEGVGGLIENLMAVFILGLLGAAAMAFGGTNVDTIAETVRRSPGRSAMVGFAGTLLLIPVWILGALALIVSIIGIPVAIAWLPLFPLVAATAALLGYIAVARNTGEWLADSGYPWTGWIRKSNPIFTVFGGLIGLMLAFMAANAISIAPFLGFLTTLLMVIGIILTVFAVHIGFGAVILTRGGRRRERWNDPLEAEAAWQAAMDVDFDPSAPASDRGGDDA